MERIRYFAGVRLSAAKSVEKRERNKSELARSYNWTRFLEAPAITRIILVLMMTITVGCAMPSQEETLGRLGGMFRPAATPEPTVEPPRPPPDVAFRQAAERQFSDRLQKAEFNHSRGAATIRIALGDVLEGRAVQSAFTHFKLFAPTAFSITEIDLLEFQAFASMPDANGSTVERTIILSMTRQTAATIDWARFEAGHFELNMGRQGDGITIDPLLWPAWVGLQNR